VRELLPFVFVSVLVGISLYFKHARNRPVTRTERTAALIWLVLRRLVCFGAALPLLALAGLLVFYMYRTSISAMGIVGLLLTSAAAFILIYYGLYGSGDRRFDLAEDKPTHELRKKRYGWRW
jgi:Na+/H+-dicarboxylate symporter